MRIARLIVARSQVDETNWLYVSRSRDDPRPGRFVSLRIARVPRSQLARNVLVPRRLGTRLSRTRRQSPLPAEESASRRGEEDAERRGGGSKRCTTYNRYEPRELAINGAWPLFDFPDCCSSNATVQFLIILG